MAFLGSDRMEVRSSLTAAEQALDALVAGRAALLDNFATLNLQHLEAMASSSWLVDRESPMLSELADLHRRVVERLLAAHIEVFATSTSALVEALAVRVMADSESAAQRRPAEPIDGGEGAGTASARIERTAVSADGDKTEQAEAMTITSLVTGGPAFAAAMSGSEEHDPDRYGSPARLLAANTERCIDHLLAEWLTAERDEARALVDDATAHAAMVRHLTQVAHGVDGVHGVPSMVADSPVDDAAHDIARRDAAALMDEAASPELECDGGAATLDAVVGLLTSAVLAELATADPGTASKRLASIADAFLGALRSHDAPLEWNDGEVAADTPVDSSKPGAATGPLSARAAVVSSGLDDPDFDVAFDAFWNSLPAATRYKMAADRQLGDPLTFTDEVVAAQATAATDPRPASVETRRLEESPRRRTASTGLRPALGALAGKVASIAGVSAAVTLAMVIIG